MADVPCKQIKCQACCQWGDAVDKVKPAAHLIPKPNGDCEHLTAFGCKVRGTPQHPKICKDYDCRVFARKFQTIMGHEYLMRILIAAQKLEEL